MGRAATLATMARRVPRSIDVAAAAVLLLSLGFAFTSAGDHPLYTPDEGRYASIGLHMAEGEGWWLPRYRGEPHLTKPPLAYWTQAAAFRALGASELSARVPSLLAGVLAGLVILGVVWRMEGRRAGVVAVAVLSLMPLHVIVGRLATTDALLAAWWVASLACAQRAVDTGRGRWAIGLWTFVALAWLTKGPLALAPIAVVVAWLAFAGRRRQIGRLWIPVGLPLSVLPLSVWVWRVARAVPEATDVWSREILTRIGQGTPAHAEPAWFHLPVALVGLLPATILVLAGAHRIPWRRVWASGRAGDPLGLWVAAIALPLLGFSLLPGKLPTYLLPLCAPAAIVCAIGLERVWASGASDARPRLARLSAVWAVGLLFWLAAFELEDRVRAPHSPSRLMADLRSETGEERIATHTFGFSDPTLSFYGGVDSLRMWNDGEIARALSTRPVAAAVLLIDDDVFPTFERNAGPLADRVTRIGTWQRTGRHRTGIYRPAEVFEVASGADVVASTGSRALRSVVDRSSGPR